METTFDNYLLQQRETSIIDAQWSVFSSHYFEDYDTTDFKKLCLRLSPVLGLRPPDFDDVASIPVLQDAISQYLQSEEGVAEVKRIAHKLIASCFHYSKTQDSTLSAQGVSSGQTLSG